MNKFYMLVTILLIILLKIITQNNSTEKFDDTNSIVKSFDSIDIPNSMVEQINELKPGETFELLDLPYCEEKFMVQYSANTDFIKNDGKHVFQDVAQPHEQIALIGDDKQGLNKISWKRSIFTFNGKQVGLELHFSHINPTNGKRIHVIFPLSLSRATKSVESFAQENSSLEKNSSLGGLNLLKDLDDVPEKVENRVNVGKMITLDLCQPSKLILEQQKFFFAETPNGESLLIAKPQNFNYDIGMKIRNNLGEPDYSIVKP